MTAERPVVPYAKIKTPKKPKGRTERFEALKDEALRTYVRRLPCVLAGIPNQARVVCGGAVQVAHVTTKGAGGGDWDNVVPLCRQHHADQHFVGLRTFEYRWGIRLKTLAKRITAAYLREKGLR